MGNPRYSNGAKRRSLRNWLKSRGDPCGICRKPIDYSLPAGHPMSFEVDEIVPVSLGGSPFSRDNLQAAHRICNQRKSNHILQKGPLCSPLPRSRDW
ncbi:HNH endonuclease [Gordonibacter massiliensis (ex Traore et al. 2017)]|uniref:HNH endonuclease n=1 Tax=Gordonibacter massiliensis (ex Traore et al. 2017) TaxID=1841863 RepID=UPI001C8B4625|nr:HNH endonuclease [Gordonibacter massiliensis (ex Traore et al. 2017)]